MKCTNYIGLQGKIFNFSKEYCKAIDQIDEIKVPKPVKLLFVILFYPSIFVLKYNAMKRVRFLCSLLIMKITLSKDCYDKNAIDKILPFKENFTDTYDPLKIMTLIFTFASSSIIISVALYLIQFSVDFQLIPTAVAAVLLVLGFNYVQYNNWRGNLKTKFSILKNQIYKL
jgi:hypothetical protein